MNNKELVENFINDCKEKVKIQSMIEKNYKHGVDFLVTNIDMNNFTTYDIMKMIIERYLK